MKQNKLCVSNVPDVILTTSSILLYKICGGNPKEFSQYNHTPCLSYSPFPAILQY